MPATSLTMLLLVHGLKVDGMQGGDVGEFPTSKSARRLLSLGFPLPRVAPATTEDCLLTHVWKHAVMLAPTMSISALSSIATIQCHANATTLPHHGGVCPSSSGT